MPAAPIMLRSGTVFDGTGVPGVVKDLLIIEGQVAPDSVAVPTGTRSIDCSGLYVTPGFIDAHAHSDLLPLLPEPQPFKLQQGVTTEIVGNCGISFAPLLADAEHSIHDMFGELAGGAELGPGSFADYLEKLRM